jgi:hypothetical protein
MLLLEQIEFYKFMRERRKIRGSGAGLIPRDMKEE